MRDYFPSKLAVGKTFCNRVEEQGVLRRNIELGRHTVLVSPRRYGKSSLVHKVVGDMKMPATYIDFFMAHDDKTIASRLLEGVGNLLSQLMPLTQKTLQLLEKYFSRLKLVMTVHGVEFSLAYQQREFDAVAQIHEGLKGLVSIAEKEKQKVVIFIDEFQDVINAEHASEIQGALRNIAQGQDWVVFVFSGSSRHLLLDIFDDRKKPFYMLCDKIELQRMSSAHYWPHIQKIAKEKWGQEISLESFATWVSLAELHPFYMNLLGHELCKKESLPSEADVINSWEECFNNERRRLVAELEYLTLNQQKVLKFLARNPVLEPMGQSALSDANLSSASMKICLKFLLERDLIFKVNFEDAYLSLFKLDQYRVLDPLLAFSLRQ